MRAKKISVDLPADLYTEAEEVMRERRVNTSVLIRDALEQYLAKIKEGKLEQDLREGYLANAELDRQVCSEFAFVDAEQAE